MPVSSHATRTGSPPCRAIRYSACACSPSRFCTNAICRPSGNHCGTPALTGPVTKPIPLPSRSTTCSSAQAAPSSSAPGTRGTDRRYATPCPSGWIATAVAICRRTTCPSVIPASACAVDTDKTSRKHSANRRQSVHIIGPRKEIDRPLCHSARAVCSHGNNWDAGRYHVGSRTSRVAASGTLP